MTMNPCPFVKYLGYLTSQAQREALSSLKEASIVCLSLNEICKGFFAWCSSSFALESKKVIASASLVQIIIPSLACFCPFYVS